MVRVHAGPQSKRACKDEFNGSKLLGGLAQLARAPALHAGGQRFESVILHKTFNRFGDNIRFYNLSTNQTDLYEKQIR